MRIVEAVSSYLDKKTNTLLVRTRGESLSDDDQDAPDYGDAPYLMALGLTSRPAPPDERGAAEFAQDETPGFDGVLVGGRDTRESSVVAQLRDGETCLHSTGKGFASRVFCKDRMVAIVVGPGTGFIIDAKAPLIQLFGFKMMIEMHGKKKELTIANGGAGIQIGNGVVRIFGAKFVFGAGNAPLSVMLGPPTGSPGGAASAPLVAANGIAPGV